MPPDAGHDPVPPDHRLAQPALFCRDSPALGHWFACEDIRPVGAGRAGAGRVAISRGHDARADLAQARADHASDLARAKAASLAAEAQSRKDAADAQARYLALSADADARDAAYAAAHRLPSPAGHPAQPAKADSASLPEIPASAAVLAALDRVWITRADWRACDADYSYALAAHQWAGAIAP